jgi:hypothetical protein
LVAPSIAATLTRSHCFTGRRRKEKDEGERREEGEACERGRKKKERKRKKRGREKSERA